VVSVSVCLCVRVCLSAIVSLELTSDLHQIFCTCYLWPWIGPSLALLHLCTSGIMDDVIFVHRPRLLDVAAQLKLSAHAALGVAINCAQ